MQCRLASIWENVTDSLLRLHFCRLQVISSMFVIWSPVLTSICDS